MGVGSSLIGLVVIVASIERIGFVGDAESEVSWPIAIPGMLLLVMSPALAAWVRWRSNWLRPALRAATIAALAAMLLGALSRSLAVGFLVWVVTQLIVTTVAPD